MPPADKSAHTKGNLIRLHPKQGGLTIDYVNQRFCGVSTDVFFGLDLNDFSQPYQITRKFNMSIAINPNHWSTEAFLAHLTNGKLEKNKKCALHGDINSGLSAHENLLSLLHRQTFHVDGVLFTYDSIGVACNSAYGPVAHRTGNDFENSTSHFEIKFRRESERALPQEYLCLNIHLMTETGKSFGKTQAIERLKQGISLFYAELGLRAGYNPDTDLQSALTVTLDNYVARGFSCKHKASLAVLLEYHEVKRYTKVKPHQVDASLKEKPKPTVAFFTQSPDDFPPLSAGNPKKIDVAGSNKPSFYC